MIAEAVLDFIAKIGFQSFSHTVYIKNMTDLLRFLETRNTEKAVVSFRFFQLSAIALKNPASIIKLQRKMSQKCTGVGITSLKIVIWVKVVGFMFEKCVLYGCADTSI